MNPKSPFLKKLPTLLLIIILTAITGGVYGILHDQITYTISPEYYTKFKFYQFGLIDTGNEAIFPNPRFQVSLVGFMATWWMGLLIGVILGVTGLIHKDYRQMLRVTIQAMFITMGIAFVTGLLGLAYGKLMLASTGVDWWLPENLIDRKNFIAVGSMHNFSYLGGLLGLIAGIVYSVRQKKKYNNGNFQTLTSELFFHVDIKKHDTTLEYFHANPALTFKPSTGWTAHPPLPDNAIPPQYHTFSFSEHPFLSSPFTKGKIAVMEVKESNSIAGMSLSVTFDSKKAFDAAYKRISKLYRKYAARVISRPNIASPYEVTKYISKTGSDFVIITKGEDDNKPAITIAYNYQGYEW